MPDSPFTFIAHLQATPSSEQALQDALQACVAPTRQEEGNVNYDLHRSVDDPTVFVIYEGWENQAALDTHFTLPHFQTLLAAAEKLVASRGPDGKPFTAETLTMISSPAAT